ncbi:glycosyltransferase family 87 protein [Pseudonocardia sp. NPDC046786]|uniref:glycosyltransferase family 87 protein n=1 Tax=Pseudonocardia sp. NPDC046786 TaxID=3155471 RepID=UPI0033C88B98
MTRPHRLVRRAAPAVTVVALLTAALLLAFGPPPLLRWIPHPDVAGMHVDFDTFWHSARALVEYGPGSSVIYATGARLHNLNPPLLSVLLAPLGALDALTGYRILTTCSVLLVAGSVAAAGRELRLGLGWTLLGLGAVLASSPLHGTLLLGQIYPLLLAGITAGWIAERRGHPVAAAVLYGITVALKPSLAPLLLLAAAQRRWRPFAAGVGAAAVATLVGVAVAGWSTAWQWLTMALAEPVGPTLDNASLPGLALRWGLPAAVGTVLGAALLLGTLAHYARRTARYGSGLAAGTDPGGTAPFAVLATGLLAAPISWHNYLLLLWPGLLALAASGRPGDTRRRVVAALFALAVIPVAWGDLWADGFPLSPLGRALYTAVLLAAWWALLRPATGPVPPGSAPVSRPDRRPGAAGEPVRPGA